MRIDDKLLKIVAFLGLRMADGNLVHVGSGFLWVGPPPESRGCLITARHVIDGVRNTGLQSIFVGLNPSNGSAEWIETAISDWMLPQNENLDLALLPRTFELADHLYFPARLTLSDQDVTALNVGIGDEVFACGLFSLHPGENRILPVVRVGNVSRYPAEKLYTDKFGTIEAFLIELRSLGGLSGSPVFIHLGPVRQIQGRLCSWQSFSVGYWVSYTAILTSTLNLKEWKLMGGLGTRLNGSIPEWLRSCQRTW